MYESSHKLEAQTPREIGAIIAHYLNPPNITGKPKVENPNKVHNKLGVIAYAHYRLHENGLLL